MSDESPMTGHETKITFDVTFEPSPSLFARAPRLVEVDADGIRMLVEIPVDGGVVSKPDEEFTVSWVIRDVLAPPEARERWLQWIKSR